MVRSLLREAVKPGVWTMDWTLDWTGLEEVWVQLLLAIETEK